MENVLVKNIPNKGRGLVANYNLNKNETIGIAPVLIIPNKQLENFYKTEAANYCFLWGKDVALALNYCSLLNHSNTPNVDYYLNKRNKTITFKTNKKVLIGQELTIDYGDELWFRPV